MWQKLHEHWAFFAGFFLPTYLLAGAWVGARAYKFFIKNHSGRWCCGSGYSCNDFHMFIFYHLLVCPFIGLAPVAWPIVIPALLIYWAFRYVFLWPIFKYVDYCKTVAKTLKPNE